MSTNTTLKCNLTYVRFLNIQDLSEIIYKNTFNIDGKDNRILL